MIQNFAEGGDRHNVLQQSTKIYLDKKNTWTETIAENGSFSLILS